LQHYVNVRIPVILSKLACFLIFATLITSASQAGICQWLLSSLNGQITSAKKATKKEVFRPTPYTVAAETSGQLNEVFSPLMKELQRQVFSATQSATQAMLIEQQSVHVIHRGYFSPDVGINLRESTNTGSQRLASTAFFKGLEVYNFDLRPPWGGLRLARSKDWALWVDPPLEFIEKYGGAFQNIGLIVTPVGVYGEGFAKKLLRTTQVIMAIASEKLTSLSVDLYDGNKDVVLQKTARGQGDLGVPGLKPLATVLEGIVSFHQMVCLLTQSGVPGSPTGRDALYDIVFNGATSAGLTTEFTKRVALGVVGPMTLGGFYFQDGLQRNSENRLFLSRQLKKNLKYTQKRAARSGRVGRCPMTAMLKKMKGDKSIVGDTKAEVPGLQALAEMYWQIFDLIDAISITMK